MNAFDLFGAVPRSADVDAAIARLGKGDVEQRGAVFTRREVVEAILDLSGYASGKPLHRKRLLEPSVGAGDFLLPAIQRLLAAFEAAGGTPGEARVQLSDAVRGVELHAGTFKKTSARVQARLRDWGMSAPDAAALCADWLTCDDFLCTDLCGEFDFVVGNPPYVRQERIPAALLQEYRRRYHTLFDRADLYVPFFERSLDLLRAGGTLGFICANRWLKNRYGGPLREKIASAFWLKYFVDTEGANAFHANVMAYPAITVIQRPSLPQAVLRTTRVVPAGALQSVTFSQLAATLLASEPDSRRVQQVDLSGAGDAPLLLDDVPGLTLIQRIERRFPQLEQSGCAVGIGVATGCDRVFVGDLDALPVEPSRKLPLLLAGDVAGGGIGWSGKGVINPFEDDGTLADLAYYPKLRTYLDRHAKDVRARHVAKRQPDAWYRTIDRIRPQLMTTPKLLVPDIKGDGVFAYDEGRYYPHHNLYYVTSDEWDLRALQAVLRSSVTLMTVATYCTRLAGGFLRFQAQYLRRIRLPRWRDVSPSLRRELAHVAGVDRQDIVDAPVFELYGLSGPDADIVSRLATAARVRKAAA